MQQIILPFSVVTSLNNVAADIRGVHVLKIGRRDLIETGAISCRLLKSGRGQPHSRTLSRVIGAHYFRQVLECGCPLPLWLYGSMTGLKRLCATVQS